MNYAAMRYHPSKRAEKLLPNGYNQENPEQVIFEMDFLKGTFDKQRARQYYNTIDLYKVFSFQKNSSKNFGN